jgi:integrase
MAHPRPPPTHEQATLYPRRDRRTRHVPDPRGRDPAEHEARDLLRRNARVGVTVREFWNDWTTDPLWLRPAASTNIHNRSRTSAFVAAHGDLPLRSVGDEHVAAWLKGGRNLSTVPALRALFNDAASAAAGRLVDRNPFAKLGLRASRGRRDTQPPTQAEIARFVALADELTPPSFAAYLHTAVYEGMRPGELDALAWEQIDFQSGTILVDRQWNALERAFTPPKHGFVRSVALTEPACERLLALPRESEFVFTTLRGSHYRPPRGRITGTAFAAPLASGRSISTQQRATTSAGTRSTSSTCPRM